MCEGGHEGVVVGTSVLTEQIRQENVGQGSADPAGALSQELGGSPLTTAVWVVEVGLH